MLQLRIRKNDIKCKEFYKNRRIKLLHNHPSGRMIGLSGLKLEHCASVLEHINLTSRYCITIFIKIRKSYVSVTQYPKARCRGTFASPTPCVHAWCLHRGDYGDSLAATVNHSDRSPRAVCTVEGRGEKKLAE